MQGTHEEMLVYVLLFLERPPAKWAWSRVFHLLAQFESEIKASFGVKLQQHQAEAGLDAL